MDTTASDPDVFSARCPSRDVLGRIADKWTVLVVCGLAKGTRRFSELQREIAGISQKMLTQTLRSLERDGLVERHVYPVIPPRVEYTLTPLGRGFLRPIRSVAAWAEAHVFDVLDAQARYDTAGGGRP